MHILRGELYLFTYIRTRLLWTSGGGGMHLHTYMAERLILKFSKDFIKMELIQWKMYFIIFLITIATLYSCE